MNIMQALEQSSPKVYKLLIKTPLRQSTRTALGSQFVVRAPQINIFLHPNGTPFSEFIGKSNEMYWLTIGMRTMTAYSTYTSLCHEVTLSFYSVSAGGLSTQGNLYSSNSHWNEDTAHFTMCPTSIALLWSHAMSATIMGELSLYIKVHV